MTRRRSYYKRGPRRKPDPLPEGVVLEKAAEASVLYETKYLVTLRGVLIGSVSSHRTESWRKHGRIRTSLRGRPLHWEAHQLPGQHWDTRVGYHYNSRVDAVKRLVEKIEEKN